MANAIREMIVGGELRKRIEIPELGVWINVTWTDGVMFKATVYRDTPQQHERRILRAAKRLRRQHPNSD